MTISFEDRDGRNGDKSSGFSVPAAITVENRRRKRVSDAGDLSQRMNGRSSPNRCLMRPSWRTVRAASALPMPPTPIRAIGSRFSAESTILTSSSHPNKILGTGGGDSPCEPNPDEIWGFHRHPTSRIFDTFRCIQATMVSFYSQLGLSSG